MSGQSLKFSLLLVAACATPLLTGCTSTGRDGGSFLSRGIGSLSGASNTDSQDSVASPADAGTAVVAEAKSSPYMDQQETLLHAQLEPKGVKVTRAGNQIVLNIPSSMAFDPNRDGIKRSAQPLLGSVGSVLKKFNRTTVEVYGHTDKGGDEKKNLDLTQKRALAVARALASNGVDPKRMSVTGFGSSRPIVSDETEEGRAENRRIEIQISPASKT